MYRITYGYVYVYVYLDLIALNRVHKLNYNILFTVSIRYWKTLNSSASIARFINISLS